MKMIEIRPSGNDRPWLMAAALSRLCGADPSEFEHPLL